jgi:8'-apo-carotenoid 13,14-cleaving dioxygenase
MNISPKLQQWLKRTASKGIRHGLGLVQRNIPYSHDNPFLDGIFAPQRQEHFSTQLNVTGQIPTELDGALMRIGPNPIYVPNPKTYHWFVGDGMVHALRIQHGQAQWYKSAYVGSDSVQKKLNRSKIQGFGKGVADAVNTNILSIAGKIWALVEAGALPIQLDVDLNSKRHQLLESELADFPFTAHPHVDPVTGDIHAVCYDALQRHQVFYLHFSAKGQLKHHVNIPVQDGPMIHDCAITHRHVLIFDLSIHFSMKTALKGASLPYRWDDAHPARIGVLPFNGTAQDIRWYPIDPCFIFHVANAFEEDNGDIVLDAVVHDKLMQRSMQGPVEDQNIQLERFIFKANSQITQRQVLSTDQQEFPRINEQFTGRQHRYIYSISFGEFANPKQVKSNQLICYDTHTAQSEYYAFDENYVTGEVVFVAKANAQAENEGWLMSYIHALDCSPSKVVILDAQNIAQGPIAVIDLPVRVPIGFHGNWIDYQTLK